MGEANPPDRRYPTDLILPAGPGLVKVTVLGSYPGARGFLSTPIAWEARAAACHHWKLPEDRGIEPFISPEKLKHSEWRAQTAPRGRIPESATPKDRMRRKLRTKRGRARYNLRQTSAEPVFGHIKEPMGFRQVPLRGQDKARSMWRPQCAAFNLMKLYRARRAACPAPALA